jgi:hypothetical protein
MNLRASRAGAGSMALVSRGAAGDTVASPSAGRNARLPPSNACIDNSHTSLAEHTAECCAASHDVVNKCQDDYHVKASCKFPQWHLCILLQQRHTRRATNLQRWRKQQRWREGAKERRR